MKNDWWNQNHRKFNYQLEHDTRHLLDKFILRKYQYNYADHADYKQKQWARFNKNNKAQERKTKRN